ncbi:MAG: phosphoribosyl-AMP cyclohydrolase [Bacillota bacterium]
MLFNAKNLKYGEDGLIPAIVQDFDTGAVLMMAYMNSEAVEKTVRSGETWFWSRSRKKFWHKGETSGNTQKVKEIYYDCDSDTLLVKVIQKGAACHEGYYSCFHNLISSDGSVSVVGERFFDPEEVYGSQGHSENGKKNN